MAKRQVQAQVRRLVGTFQDRFLKQLKISATDENLPVLNSELKSLLGWTDDRYVTVRDQLVQAKLIGRAPGERGKVQLLQAPPPTAQKACTLFISYSHADEFIKDELLKHLRPIMRMGLLESWHDRQIEAGADFKREISDKLDAAQIIILLVSVDFINSEYCYGIEVKRAVERNAEKAAVVVPVIARQCLWHDTPFGKILALPRDGKAITSLPDRDDALTKVAEGILSVIQTINKGAESR